MVYSDPAHDYRHDPTQGSHIDLCIKQHCTTYYSPYALGPCLPGLIARVTSSHTNKRGWLQLLHLHFTFLFPPVYLRLLHKQTRRASCPTAAAAQQTTSGVAVAVACMQPLPAAGPAVAALVSVLAMGTKLLMMHLQKGHMAVPSGQRSHMSSAHSAAHTHTQHSNAQQDSEGTSWNSQSA